MVVSLLNLLSEVILIEEDYKGGEKQQSTVANVPICF